MDPFLFSLLLAVGLSVGWAIGRVMGKPSAELPLYLLMGGTGALLGGVTAQLSINPSFGAVSLLTASVAVAILVVMIFRMGMGRLAG